MTRDLQAAATAVVLVLAASSVLADDADAVRAELLAMDALNGDFEDDEAHARVASGFDPDDPCVLVSTTTFLRQPERPEDAVILIMVWDVLEVTFDFSAATLLNVAVHNACSDAVAQCEATAMLNFDGPAAHYRVGGGDYAPLKNKKPEPSEFFALNFQNAEEAARARDLFLELAAACGPQP
ncbi:MAG: hypothetical protein AAF563_10340 [Pseudomonadota bacterium]